LDGNAAIKVWFGSQATELLEIQTRSQVETHCSNPFSFLLEPWATKLPIDYPTSTRLQLQPYLQGYWHTAGIDPVAIQLAQEIHHAKHGETIGFLTALNQQIYQTCQHTIRETGAPLPPGVTWTEKSGSCRDTAILFMEVCRAVGLAARFVSGYQEGDPDADDRHLHAWAEVFLPGAGWRGYDPTHGLAVADGHIAVAASAMPESAAPVKGGYKGEARSELSYKLLIQPAIAL
jgi:transglutaminase-like putative cysteine protease